ncbi:hypothetical protein Slin15195_G087710 [Septoria linicola]|uniref:Uncharacterized protein n=1 Tax=Septoria linicola TaxID=215465 RepID=A0A9Q9B0Y6_9PEZI|nr:hypothetical protein Slin15195_G087710 [Septoria linicola]
MAVSLSQSLQEAHRRSRGSSMGEHYQAGAGNHLMSQQYPHPYVVPAPQYQAPASSFIEHKQPFYNAHAIGPQHELPPPRPPRPQPQQIPAQPPPLYQTPTISIEPDPLPPHSSPQALTPSQSHAFQNSSPIPPLRLSYNDIRDAHSGQILFTPTREAAHIPAFLSSKPIVICTRTSNHQIMGQIHFHSFTTPAIDLTINNRKSFLAHSGVLHDRWGFPSTTSRSSSGGAEEMWYWSKDKSTPGGVRLENAKKNGKVLARMKGDVLSCGDGGRMERESWVEVVLSAVAVVEAARRQRKGVDLSDAMGDFRSGSGHGGGHHGGGDGGGGGGS